MCSVTFVLRASRRGRDFAGHLFIRLIHERRVRTLTTPYKVYHDEWNARHQCFVYNGADTARTRELSRIEVALSRDRIQIESIIEHLEGDGLCSAAAVADYFRHRKDKKSLDLFTRNLSEQLNNQGRERTARAYRTVTRGFLNYIGRNDLSMDKMESSLFQSFEKHLKDRGRAANTISYYMRNLRAIYNRGVNEGLITPIDSNPFSHVYTGVRPTRKRALNRRDIMRLYDLDLLDCKTLIDKGKNKESKQALLDAQRLFFFSFHARGMSFVDLAYLRKDQIRNGVMSYYRKKTGCLLEIKVTPAMQNIINCFADRMRNSSYLFPIINDCRKSKRLQYESGLRIQNKRLDSLRLLAGIKSKVTTHVARHSWATMAKGENLPLWVISEGLGHSNEKTTYTYLASFERSVLDKASERISTLFRTSKKASIPTV